MLLDIKNLNKSFQVNDKRIQILNDLSFSIDSNKITSIYGASGSGKSTLLNIISGLMSSDSGSISFDGKLMDNNFDFITFRKQNLGIVFQEDYLLSEFTAIENIMLPHIIAGNSKKNAYEKAYHLLDKFNLSSIKNSYHNTLSGGEKQRVSILRSIINNPKLILADEPTGALDSKTSIEIMTILNDLNAKGITVVLVTHEDDIAKYGSRIIKMKDGQIIEDKKNVPN